MTSRLREWLRDRRALRDEIDARSRWDVEASPWMTGFMLGQAVHRGRTPSVEEARAYAATKLGRPRP